jgi:hypothetical protein
MSEAFAPRGRLSAPPGETDDSVMYDTPLEFISDAIQRQDECAAQSVIPRADGTYACGCSCERWEATAPSIEEGLRLAREHTARRGPTTPPHR